MSSALEPLRSALLADRATPLLVAAVRASRAQTVLLPGLYCPDVAASLSDAGFILRYYDLDATLTPELPAAGGERTALIWYHPFGLYRPPPSDAQPIVDACHALRTLASRPTWPGVTVVSFRKEFGWSFGAAAAGLPAASDTTAHALLTHRLQSEDFSSAVTQGRAATILAELHLAHHLPPIRDGDVLTHLPLLSHNRDAVIARLREAALGAWRWLAPLPGVDLCQLPVCAMLRRWLLLVPLPSDLAAAAALLARIKRENLLSWSEALTDDAFHRRAAWPKREA